MFQVSAYSLVILARVVKTKMLANLNGYHSEKFTHHLQGIPRALEVRIRIGFLQHGPVFRFKILLEVFTKFSLTLLELVLPSHVPREHFYQVLADFVDENVLGSDYAFPPQPLTNE